MPKKSTEGSKPFKALVLDLRPTQFAVGMLEVDEKIAEVRAFDKKALKAYVKDNVVPVVRSPSSGLFVVDKHHYLSVCYHLGINKIYVQITRDFSGHKMSFLQFWKWMGRSRNSYPYCQFGEGPRNELYLPRDIRGLADDPYRSLAWYVRKSGGFENSEKNFAEFQWANFFRSRKLLDRAGLAGFEAALMKAVKLAQSAAAKDLPGYGKLNLAEQAKVKATAKKKILRIRKRAERAKKL